MTRKEELDAAREECLAMAKDGFSQEWAITRFNEMTEEINARHDVADDMGW